MMMLKKLGKAEAEVMVYVRKSLGGESSSVACGWAHVSEGGGDGGAFNICLGDSQKSTEKVLSGLNKTASVAGQMLQ